MAYQKVMSIKKVPFKGIVYNLAVEKDETYYANDVLVHNCRSYLTPVIIGDKEDKRSFFYDYDKRFKKFGTGVPVDARRPAEGFGG